MEAISIPCHNFLINNFKDKLSSSVAVLTYLQIFKNMDSYSKGGTYHFVCNCKLLTLWAKKFLFLLLIYVMYYMLMVSRMYPIVFSSLTSLSSLVYISCACRWDWSATKKVYTFYPTTSWLLPYTTLFHQIPDKLYLIWHASYHIFI